MEFHPSAEEFSIQVTSVGLRTHLTELSEATASVLSEPVVCVLRM